MIMGILKNQEMKVIFKNMLSLKTCLKIDQRIKKYMKLVKT